MRMSSLIVLFIVFGVGGNAAAQNLREQRQLVETTYSNLLRISGGCAAYTGEEIVDQVQESYAHDLVSLGRSERRAASEARSLRRDAERNFHMSVSEGISSDFMVRSCNEDLNRFTLLVEQARRRANISESTMPPLAALDAAYSSMYFARQLCTSVLGTEPLDVIFAEHASDLEAYGLVPFSARAQSEFLRYQVTAMNWQSAPDNDTPAEEQRANCLEYIERPRDELEAVRLSLGLPPRITVVSED